jgi:hypothetical protein
MQSEYVNKPHLGRALLPTIQWIEVVCGFGEKSLKRKGIEKNSTYKKNFIPLKLDISLSRKHEETLSDVVKNGLE